jgi:hypothetical protein
MTLPLARNAQDILAARLRGFKPDEMVMVSLGGPLHTANKVVFAAPDTEYDWRWVRGLDIGVWISDAPNWAEAGLPVRLACLPALGRAGTSIPCPGRRGEQTRAPLDLGSCLFGVAGLPKLRLRRGSHLQRQQMRNQ